MAFFSTLKTVLPLLFGNIIDETRWTVTAFHAIRECGEIKMVERAILRLICEVIEKLLLGLGRVDDIRISCQL